MSESVTWLNCSFSPSSKLVKYLLRLNNTCHQIREVSYISHERLTSRHLYLLQRLLLSITTIPELSVSNSQHLFASHTGNNYSPFRRTTPAPNEKVSFNWFIQINIIIEMKIHHWWNLSLWWKIYHWYDLSLWWKFITTKFIILIKIYYW